MSNYKVKMNISIENEDNSLDSINILESSIISEDKSESIDGVEDKMNTR